MEYEDRITIWAPEGLALEYTLAGLGSRFLAELADVLVRIAVLGALIGMLAAIGAASTLLLIVLVVGAFLALFAYDVAFEVWGAGRTPGKRWNGLRVLMASGQPVSFAPSAVRNVMRVVDIWGTAMIAGVVSILLTKRSQRLGDLAAGTIVVRERRAVVRTGASAARSAAVAADCAGAASDARAGATPGAPTIPTGIDVTAVSAAELSAIRDFIARRDQLTKEARARVARALADGVAGKVGGLPPNGLQPERLLETIAAAKSASRYGSAPPT